MSGFMRIWSGLAALWDRLRSAFPEFWTLRAPLFWSLVISYGMWSPAQVKELYLINAEKIDVAAPVVKYFSLQTVGEVYLPLLAVAFLVFWLRIICYQILNFGKSTSWREFTLLGLPKIRHPRAVSLLICSMPQLVLFAQTIFKARSSQTPSELLPTFWILVGIQAVFVLLSLGFLAKWTPRIMQPVFRQICEKLGKFFVWLNALSPLNLFGAGGAVAAAIIVLMLSGFTPFGGIFVLIVFLLMLNLPYQPITFWAVAVVLILAVFVICADPVSAGLALGPLGLLSLFACCLVLITTCFGMIEDRFHFPASILVVGAALFFSLRDWNDNHMITMVESAPHDMTGAVGKNNRTDFQNAFQAWLECRPDYARAKQAGNRYPVYLIAAQGGGLYAAYHSASFLAAIQDRSPEFREHIFAASGVSGGSVGVTIFSALTSIAEPARVAENCQATAASRADGTLGGKNYTENVEAILQNDFLSPVGAALLFPDMLSRLLPFAVPSADRTLALEQSFERSFYAATLSHRLNEPVLAQWDPAGSTPALLLNTIDVDTGRRMVVTPFDDLGDVITFRDAIDCPRFAVSCLSPTLASGMLLSARFPLVTPAGTLMLPKKSITSHLNYSANPKDNLMKARFVDGGYFENSGLDTIADLIEELRVLNLGDTVVFRVLTFDFPITELNPKRSYGLGEVASPIRALNSARSARIDSARNRIKDMQGALWVDLISISLDDKLTEFPLGWTLSKYTFHRMDCDLYSELACASIGRNLYSGADAEPNSVARENRRRLNLIVTEIDNPTLMTQAVLTHSDLPEQLKARR